MGSDGARHRQGWMGRTGGGVVEAPPPDGGIGVVNPQAPIIPRPQKVDWHRMHFGRGLVTPNPQPLGLVDLMSQHLHLHHWGPWRLRWPVAAVLDS